MKVLIVGGGFTGLAAGVRLVDESHNVTLVEKEKVLGGLGNSFKADGWNWNLEKFYHHIFANDKQAIKMASKVGCKFFLQTPKTCSLIDDKFYQLDSPTSLLKFSALNLRERLMMGVGLGILKAIPNGAFLEKYRVVDVLPRLMGRKAYGLIWKPMLTAKFGKYLPQVNMAWFWARVYKRTQALGYFEGGFGMLAEKMGEYVERKGGKIVLGTEITNKDFDLFDRVILTVPGPVAEKLLAMDPTIRGCVLNYLWAQTLVLELSKSLIPCYWLNVLEKKWPFLVVVEHTRLIDKNNYGGSHIVYLGRYLEKPKEWGEILKYLKKLNPKFENSWIKNKWEFEQPFAQPVMPVNYSKALPRMRVNEKVYMANISMVYPWDRGVNYAIETGRKVAELVMKEYAQ